MKDDRTRDNSGMRRDRTDEPNRRPSEQGSDRSELDNDSGVGSRIDTGRESGGMGGSRTGNLGGSSGRTSSGGSVSGTRNNRE